MISLQNGGVNYRVFVGQRSFGSCTLGEDGSVHFSGSFERKECTLWCAYDDSGLKDPALYFEELQSFKSIATDGATPALWIDLSEENIAVLTQTPAEDEDIEQGDPQGEDEPTPTPSFCEQCGAQLFSASAHLDSCSLHEQIPQDSEAYDFFSAFHGMREKISDERFVLPETERYSFALNYLSSLEISDIFAVLSPDDSADFQQGNEHPYLNVQLPLGSKMFTITVDVTAVEDHYKAEIHVVAFAMDDPEPSAPQGEPSSDAPTNPTDDSQEGQTSDPTPDDPPTDPSDDDTPTDPEPQEPKQDPVLPVDSDESEEDDPTDPFDPNNEQGEDDLTPEPFSSVCEECGASLASDSEHFTSCAHYAVIPQDSAARDFLCALPGMCEDAELTSLTEQYEVFGFVLNYLEQEDAVAVVQAFESNQDLPEEEQTLPLRAEKVFENKFFTIVANVTKIGGYYKVQINLTGYAD